MTNEQKFIEEKLLPFIGKGIITDFILDNKSEWQSPVSVGESLKVEATAARAALDTPTCIADVKNMYNYTSCELNQQGLELAVKAAERSFDEEDITPYGTACNIIQAYLPYHNTDLHQASNWQNIETAPKDQIIFLSDGKNVDYYCRWHKNRWNFWGLDDFDGMSWLKLSWQPTHWQPLTQPPQGEKS
jgi:hypothetical protein